MNGNFSFVNELSIYRYVTIVLVKFTCTSANLLPICLN